MKRKILILLAAAMATLSLTACGSFTCDLCGEEGKGGGYKTTVWGEEVTICKDCKADLKELQDAFDWKKTC